jgi:PAS domain S-box-containing protein
MFARVLAATWMLHVACACVYLTMAVLVIARRPREPLNRACGALILCFFHWSACLAVSHHPDASRATAQLFYSIGSLAWGSFASLTVLFIAVFWRPTLLRWPWFWVALVLPPIIVIEAQWTGRLATAYPLFPWGHGFVWRDSLQTNFFIAHYAIYMVGALALLLVASFSAGTPPVRRVQARIIVFSAILPLVAGSLTDVELPRAGAFVVPNMAPDFTIIWVFGLVYAIVKYRMLELTPAVAADRVVETMSDALFLVQPDGCIAWANPAAVGLFGYAITELRGQSISHFLDEDRGGEPLLRSGRHDLAVRRKDGHRLEIVLSMAEIRGGLAELAGWVCVATDVTARSLAEAELRRAHDTLESRVVERTEELQRLNIRLVSEIGERKRSEDHYRLLIESMHEGLWVLDQDDRTTLVNSCLGTILDFSPAELLGRPLLDFVGEASTALCRETLRNAHRGQAGQGDWQLSGRDGKTRNTIVQLSPLRGEAGAYLGCVVTVMDVTERESMRAQLSRAERLASMGLMAAGVGHEINNPLTYVIGNLEEIARTVEQHPAGLIAAIPPVAALAREALKGTYRVREIVKELRRFSRAENHHGPAIDAHDAIEEAIKVAQAEIRPRARLVRKFAPRLPAVEANRTGLSQVMLNLLLNAAQSIVEGAPEENEIRVQTWHDGDGVSIQVSDTGTGIRPEHLDKIFDPFFSTKQASDGQGLGLAISHEIIAAAGGRLSVKSRLGAGTEFVITLREGILADGAVPLPLLVDTSLGAANNPASPAAVAQARILIIDDEDLIRRVLIRQLERYFRVVDVASAEQAKELLTADPHFDLLFCDMMMPGMSGMALADWIHSRAPTLTQRIIFMTGGAFTRHAETYLASAANPVLEKPFQAGQVLKVARETLGRLA